MNRQPEYLKTLPTRAAADAWMRMKNTANRMPGWLFVLVDGPEDGAASVMDIRSAIDGEFLYSWSAR